MSFPDLLDSHMNIKRGSGADDGHGGYSSTSYSVLYLNIPCRFEALDKTTDQLRIVSGEQEIYPDFIVYCEFLSGIREMDRLYHGSRTFDIKLIENWSLQDKYMRLFVVEVGRND